MVGVITSKGYPFGLPIEPVEGDNYLYLVRPGMNAKINNKQLSSNERKSTKQRRDISCRENYKAKIEDYIEQNKSNNYALRIYNRLLRLCTLIDNYHPGSGRKLTRNQEYYRTVESLKNYFTKPLPKSVIEIKPLLEELISIAEIKSDDSESYK